MEGCQSGSASGSLLADCQALQAQALECRSAAGLAAPSNAQGAAQLYSSAQHAAALAISGPVPELDLPLDIEEGGSMLQLEKSAEQGDPEAGWQLTAESKRSSVRGGSSLVFVNPRALLRALSRYSVAVTGRLSGMPQQPARHASADSVVAAPGSGGAEGADGGSFGQSAQLPRSRQLLAAARRLVLRQVEAVEQVSRERGYSESLLHTDCSTDNEEYTNRQASSPDGIIPAPADVLTPLSLPDHGPPTNLIKDDHLLAVHGLLFRFFHS